MQNVEDSSLYALRANESCPSTLLRTRCDESTTVSPFLKNRFTHHRSHLAASAIVELLLDHSQLLYACSRPLADHSEWSNAREQPLWLQQHTGLRADHIEYLYDLCSDELVQYRMHHRTHRVHGQASYGVPPHDMLLMTLMFLRCAFSFGFLAQLFGVTPMTARNIVRATLEIMNRCVVPVYIQMPDLHAPDCPGDFQHPSIKLIVDTTCIPHTKCQTPPLNKRYFYHKSPTKYGVKVQVVIDMRYQIVHVADAVPGADHDLTIARRSGIISFLGDDVKMLGDKAYLGEPFIVTPKKKPRGRELTSDELAANRVLHSTRAAVEQVNKRLKDFHQMRDASMFSPTDLEMYSMIARVCAALTNMLMLEQPIVARYVVADP